MDGDPNDPSVSDAAPAGPTADPSIGPPESAAGPVSGGKPGESAQAQAQAVSAGSASIGLGVDGSAAGDESSGSAPSATGSSTPSTGKPGETSQAQAQAAIAGNASIGLGTPSDPVGSALTVGKTALAVIGAILGGPLGLLAGLVAIGGMAHSGAYGNVDFGGIPAGSGTPPGTFGGGPDFQGVKSSPVKGFGGVQVNTPQAYGPTYSGFLPGTVMALNNGPTTRTGTNYSYAAKLDASSSAAGGIDIPTALVIAAGAALLLK